MVAPRCRSINHSGGCDDPRCPEKLYRLNALERAVSTGSLEPLLESKPRVEASNGVSQEEFFDPEMSAARARRRERWRQMVAKREAEGWTPPPPPPPVLGLRIRDSDRKYRDQLLAGIRRDARLRVDAKTGRKTVSIYRSGVVEPPETRGVEAESYALCDGYLPEGRVGRTRGLFASVSLDTGARWVRGNNFSGMKDGDLRELRVDPDTTHIYSVSNWERVSSAHSDRGYSDGAQAHYEQTVANYWSQSMTLTQWYEYMESNPEVDPRDWEILVDTEQVQAVKPVSWKRLIEGCVKEYERKDLTRIAKLQGKRV